MCIDWLCKELLLLFVICYVQVFSPSISWPSGLETQHIRQLVDQHTVACVCTHTCACSLRVVFGGSLEGDPASRALL